MNAVSILSLVSASLTITMRATTIGKDLNSLKNKFSKADKEIRHLSIHVSAIRLAVRSLSSWLENDTIGSEEVEEINGELLEVLSACCEILSDLQDHVSKIRAGAESVGFKGSLQFIWDEDIIVEAAHTLHQQEVAILLILGVLERTEKAQQRAQLKESANHETLSKAKRPSSSIFGLSGTHRSSVRYSIVSENSDKLEVFFSFDTEVMASTAYRNCFASLIKQNVHTKGEGTLARTAPSLATRSIQARPLEVPSLKIVTVAVASPSRKHSTSNSPVPQQEDDKDQRQAEAKTNQREKSLNGMFVRAVYDYATTDKGSLSFHERDVIQVITQLESGWWDGVFNGSRGWFPSNYCRLLDSKELQKLLEDDFYTHEMDETELENEEKFWIPQATKDGRLFYFNTLTGVSRMSEDIT